MEPLAQAPRCLGNYHPQIHRPLIGTGHLGRWGPGGHHQIHRPRSSKRRRVNLFRYQGMNNLRPGRMFLFLDLARLNPKADGPEGLGQAGSRLLLDCLRIEHCPLQDNRGHLPLISKSHSGRCRRVPNPPIRPYPKERSYHSVDQELRSGHRAEPK